VEIEASLDFHAVFGGESQQVPIGQRRAIRPFGIAWR